LIYVHIQFSCRYGAIIFDILVREVGYTVVSVQVQFK
jgi:hypothetical protein